MVLDSPLVNCARKETTCNGGSNDNEYSWAFSVRSQGERIVNAERRDEQGRAQAYIGRACCPALSILSLAPRYID